MTAEEAAKGLYKKSTHRLTQKWEDVSEIIREKWRVYERSTSSPDRAQKKN